MRILVLTSYFRPDLSAGSFRMTAFVDQLVEAAPAGSQIDVITSLPSRYHSFTADADAEEHNSGVSIYRIQLPKHASGILDQSRAFLTFARGALSLIKGRSYDVVFATSSKLMTAALGAHIARRQKAPLYLDIRDIFVDTLNDLVLRKFARLADPFFSALERWTIKSASKVNLVSQGFESYFAPRYPNQRFSYITNGIDDEFLAAAPTQPGPLRTRHDGRPIVVLYAGNIGEGQGLHVMIPKLAERMGAGVQFRIIGDGGRKVALQQALTASGVANVAVLPPVTREVLMEEYRAADVLFLQLGDYPALTKVLPSKLFEYGALGKPIWAGTAGFTASWVNAEITNAAVFHPNDLDDALRAFDRLQIQVLPRTEFCAKFTRVKLSRALADDLLSVASESDELDSTETRAISAH